jgi:cyanophycin synthetase
MKLAIKSSKIFSGPSIYAQMPIVLFSLSESVTSEEQGATGKILDVLESMLPTLRYHSESCDVMTEYKQNGAKGMRANCHLFEHLCMVLQGEMGTEKFCVRSQAEKYLQDNDAVVSFGSYGDPDVCLHAAQLAIELIAVAGSDQFTQSPGTAERQNVETQLKEFRNFVRTRKLKRQDYAFIKAAQMNGIPVRKLVGRLLVLGHGRYQRRINGGRTDLVNVVSSDIAENKDYTRRVLSAIGLKVPPYQVVSAGKEAVNAAKLIGYPVVVKPNNAGNGKGVTIGVYDREEIREAYKSAREFDRSVLIEQFLEGSEYLLLVIKGKFHSALKCLPVHVVGDGLHTIDQLIMQFNSRVDSDINYPSTRNELSFDKQTDDLLLIQGYDRLSVPAKDVIVYLHRNANPSAGGMAYDVTKNVHPDNCLIAERAARAIGLEFCSVDMFTADIASPIWESGGAINGISSRLGDMLHLWAGADKTGHMQQAIMSMMLKYDRSIKIPIVAITGIGKTGFAAKVLAEILTKANWKVGLAVEGSVYSVGNIVVLKDFSAPEATRAILFDPDVDIAVLELKPRDVFLNGLDNSSIDHTVIVSPAESGVDKVTPSIEELDALRVVAYTTTGTVYAFENDGFSIPIQFGNTSPLPKVRRIRTDTYVPYPVSQAAMSSPTSKFWSTLVNIGLKSNAPKEDKQATVHEDFVLFGGLNADQVKSLRSKLFSLTAVADKEDKLRAVLAAYAIAVEIGIEPTLSYRVLSEFNFD